MPAVSNHAGIAASQPTTGVSLQTILEQFRDDARSNRDLGDRFESWILR